MSSKSSKKTPVIAMIAAATLAACGTDPGAAITESIDLADPIPALLPWQSDTEAVNKTGSGLEYVILVAGDKSVAPVQKTDMVTVHYDGRLAADGKQFDSSRARGQPASFPANALIAGWVEALQLMRPGDRWVLYIPYQLAYGEQGRPPLIPPASALVFDVELLEIKNSAR